MSKVTEEMREKIRADYDAGHNVEAIGARYGLSKSHTSVVARQGREIRSTGVSYKLTRAQKEEIVQIAATGEKLLAIAMKYGISRQGVRDILRVRGVPPRSRTGVATPA